MPIDAAPSSRGAFSACAAAIPTAAISTPRSAAVSSKSTVNVVGSLLSRNARGTLLPLDRIEALATPHDSPRVQTSGEHHK